MVTSRIKARFVRDRLPGPLQRRRQDHLLGGLIYKLHMRATEKLFDRSHRPDIDQPWGDDIDILNRHSLLNDVHA